MSSKAKTAKLPKKAGGTPAAPSLLTKIVQSLLQSDRKESATKNKGMAIVPSISNWIVSKWSKKPAKHQLRAAVVRGIQSGVLQRLAASRTGLNGSIKLHPKFAKLLMDQETSGNDSKAVASAIAFFIKTLKSSPPSSPEQKADKPKQKAAATVKKPKANIPVAQKQKQPAAKGSGTAKKRSAKAHVDEPKAKNAKK